MLNVMGKIGTILLVCSLWIPEFIGGSVHAMYKFFFLIGALVDLICYCLFFA